MATKIKHKEYSIEEFNAWTKFIGFGTRFDYNNFENRELVKRIEDAKFALENPKVPNPSDQLESQQTENRSILSGIKSILNLF
jgi:hypothetical protein